MPILPFVVICSLSLVVLVFLYFVLFRIPRAQVDDAQLTQLQSIYDEDVSARLTILMVSKHLSRQEIKTVILIVDGYEQIDMRRIALPRKFPDYDSLTDVIQRIEIQEDTLPKHYEYAQRKLNELVIEYEKQGWQIKADLPFSDIDHVTYLAKPLN